MLLQHCCQTWLPNDPAIRDQAAAVFSSVFNHLDIVTEACVYGPVFRRDQRLIQAIFPRLMFLFLNVLLTTLLFFIFQRLVLDVQIYVEQLGAKCAANVAVTR